LAVVEINRMLSSMNDVAKNKNKNKSQRTWVGDCRTYARSLCVAKSCSLDFKHPIAYECLFPNLAPDMLPFAIAISPNEQNP
jgi:hypothetical protein